MKNEMILTLASVKFLTGLSGYGYQETDENGHLIGLYNQDGDQLHSGSYFPNATWDYGVKLDTYQSGDTDSFWAIIEANRIEGAA